VGAATLTTFFSQCFSSFVCVPQNSQLTITIETTNGSRLILLGYSPSLGQSTQTDDGTRIEVAGTWTISPSSTGRFAGAHGAGRFVLVVFQPVGSIGGTEQVTLTGTMTP
jgi:hypothetical protein